MAARHNPTLQLLPGSKAKLRRESGRFTNITHSTPFVKLVWGLRGCRAGVQHCRTATAHGMNKPHALHCFFCNGDAAACAELDALKLPASERQLIGLLIDCRMSEHFCWQACVKWWTAPVDFLLLHHKVIIQADGCSHFTTMHKRTSDEALHTDLSFCVHAVQAQHSVIRVHDTQLQTGIDPGCLQEAVAHAKTCVCVVLSHSYATVSLCVEGQQWLLSDWHTSWVARCNCCRRSA